MSKNSEFSSIRYIVRLSDMILYVIQLFIVRLLFIYVFRSFDQKYFIFIYLKMCST